MMARNNARPASRIVTLTAVVWLCCWMLPIISAQMTSNKKFVDKSLLANFDTDIRDDCRSLLVHCQSNIFSHVYLQCPKSCSEMLEVEGMKGTSDMANNADALYDVGTLRTYQGKRIDADRFEGYVTVVSIIPLLPGMAVYYYEMMEHLHSVFAPKVEFVVIPIDHEQEIHIVLHKYAKVVMLEEESNIENHPWVRHLTSIPPRSGAGTKNHRDETVQLDLHQDRVTIYIVSADGYYIERLISPRMATLQQKIAVYTKTIDYEL